VGEHVALARFLQSKKAFKELLCDCFMG